MGADLPDVPMPTEKVETPGGPLLVHGLTAMEAVKVGKVVDSGDVATAEITVIAFGTDNQKADVKEWYERVPAGTVKEATAAIYRLSGLDEEASKSVEGGDVEG